MFWRIEPLNSILLAELCNDGKIDDCFRCIQIGLSINLFFLFFAILKLIDDLDHQSKHWKF